MHTSCIDTNLPCREEPLNSLQPNLKILVTEHDITLFMAKPGLCLSEQLASTISLLFFKYGGVQYRTYIFHRPSVTADHHEDL